MARSQWYFNSLDWSLKLSLSIPLQEWLIWSFIKLHQLASFQMNQLLLLIQFLWRSLLLKRFSYSLFSVKFLDSSSSNSWFLLLYNFNGRIWNDLNHTHIWNLWLLSQIADLRLYLLRTQDILNLCSFLDKILSKLLYHLKIRIDISCMFFLIGFEFTIFFLYLIMPIDGLHEVMLVWLAITHRLIGRDFFSK